MSADRTPLQLHIAVDADRVTVGFPPGTALTEGNADELQRGLAAAVAGRDSPHLVLDLSGVTVLTSVILSKFLTTNKQVRAAGGKLALHNPAPDIFQVFKVTRLDTVLDIRTDAAGVPA